MRSKKKSIAVLSVMLALVLAVQAFAFTAAKLGDSKAEDSVKAGPPGYGRKAREQDDCCQSQAECEHADGCAECYLNEAGNGVHCTAGC